VACIGRAYAGGEGVALCDVVGVVCVAAVRAEAACVVAVCVAAWLAVG